MEGYLTPAEIDGEIKPKLEKRLNTFIRALRSLFSIHCMMTGKHSKRSYHYKGLAADGHKGRFKLERRPTDEDINLMAINLQNLINKPKKTLFEQAVIARLCGFNGVGMYPHWYPKPGLHVDLRSPEEACSWIGLNKDKLKKIIKESDDKESQIYLYLV